MQGRVDPVQLLLARCVVPDDRVNMAVDQTRRQGDALRVHDRIRLIGIEILLIPKLSNPAIDGDNAISIRDGSFDLARQQKADIANDQFFVFRHLTPPYLICMLTFMKAWARFFSSG